LFVAIAANAVRVSTAFHQKLDQRGRHATAGAEEMPIGDDRIGRDLRRYQLAMRLVAHEARTGTICDWTGLTRERLKTLRREWGIPMETRHRGPSPTSVSVFFRSPRVRSEASLLAMLCRMMGAVSSTRMPDAARLLPSLDRGERLCDAFEAFRVCLPESPIEFEQVVLLALALAQGDALELGHCRNCDAVMLVDRLAVGARICSFCHRSTSQAASLDEADPVAGDPDKGAEEESAGQQGSLF
jgi:hypothetical protein